MSEPPASDDSGRLVACRSCGNRVPRVARRCPACGAREPTSAAPPPEIVPAPSPPAGYGRLAAALVVGALIGAAATAAVFTLRSAPAPPAVLERRPDAVVPASPATAPAEPAAAPGAEPPAPEPARTVTPSAAPSRSRGRTDWLFFFKPGDQLVHMGDDAQMGMVIRVVPRQPFADGTVGPAYVLQLPDGGQRVVDADELERGGRLR